MGWAMGWATYGVGGSADPDRKLRLAPLLIADPDEHRGCCPPLADQLAKFGKPVAERLEILDRLSHHAHHPDSPQRVAIARQR